MDDLFALTDLAATLQVDLDTSSAAEARRKAQADLVSATRLTVWPTPIPEDLRSWGLQLAALYYDNPSMLEMEQNGATMTRWQLSRRDDILKLARSRYSGLLAGDIPIGAFPLPDPWPDPYTRVKTFRSPV